MNKKITYTLILIITLSIIGGIYYTMTQPNQNTSKQTTNPSQNTKVLLETTKGNIIIELYPQQQITSTNFKNLVQKGTYNGIIFHRIINGFMIQGGDPTGTGYGDKSIPQIKDEFNGEQKNNKGTISMANAGPNTGSSQFFINLANNNFLDGKHPVFGKVIEGMNIVDTIANVKTDSNDKPLEDVKIIRATIVS